MKILSRYLLREHVGPFAFALGALTGLLLLNQIARRFADLIGKGLSWDVITAVFALSLPFILAMTIPMATLVAVLQAFTRMGQDAEITALKASGVNLTRMMRPVLAAFTLVALGEFLFVDQALPRFNHQLRNLLVDIARKKPTFELREQAVNEVVPNQLFLRAGRIDQATDRMRDVVIYDLANPQRRRTIYADSGTIRFNNERTDLLLTLHAGYIHDYDRQQAASFRRIFFTTDVIKVGGVSNRLERSNGTDEYRSDRELTLCEMEKTVQQDLRTAASVALERRRAYERDVLALVGVAPPPGDTARPPVRRSITSAYCALLDRIGKVAAPTPAEAQEVRDPRIGTRRRLTPQAPAQPADTALQRRLRTAPDQAGIQLRSTLATLEAQQRAVRQHAASYQVEIHKKYSLAVSCIVFVLIGAPMALRFPRGGVGMVIGASVVIFGFYYIGLIGGESLADREVISPFWAMWTPNLVMAAGGLWLFTRLGRERATARGGTIREFFAARRRRRRARRAA